MKIQPAANREQNRNKVCSDFCRFHRVTLRGCTFCPLQPSRKPPKPLRNNVGYELSSESSLKIPPVSGPSLIHRTPNINTIGFAADIQATTSATTTPDWNRLCIQLCRQGNGGLLCNCDLAPF